MSRAVHDIIASRKDPRMVVAFIQHGDGEDVPFEYENVCPWCEKTVGDFVNSDGNMQHVLKALRLNLEQHLPFCTASGYKINVHRTSVPLGTDGGASEEILH